MPASPNAPEYLIHKKTASTDISAALEAIRASGGGGCLRFEPGPHHLDEPIVVGSSGVWLVGSETILEPVGGLDLPFLVQFAACSDAGASARRRCVRSR